MKKLIYISIIFSFLAACTQKNSDFFPETPVNENLSGQTIKYNIQLSSAANTPDSTLSVQGTIAYLNMNDSIYTDTANADGLLTFGHLADGEISVHLENPNFYSYSYIIKLKSDTTIYNTQNYRNVSTLVKLLPKSTQTQGIVTGIIQADTNALINGNENINQNITLFATLSDSTQKSFAQAFNQQNIIDAWFELPLFYTYSSKENFSLQLPATNQGLNWLISADNFVAQKVTPSDTITSIYGLNPVEINLYPQSNTALKLIFIEQ